MVGGMAARRSSSPIPARSRSASGGAPDAPGGAGTPGATDRGQGRGIDLGIDLGTTRTVVALADRGNYPVVTFTDVDGDEHDFVPSLTALVDGRLVHGFEARAAAREGAPLLRSLKRVLGRPDVTAATPVRLGDTEMPVMDVLVSYLEALRALLVDSGALNGADAGSADSRVVVAVPAHAYGAQRMLTLDAFRAAGFHVTALVNEPSAAGFEYTHRKASTLSSRRTRVLVYDLGGGTFDTSLVDARGSEHEVLASRGLPDLGGDDVDLLLAQMVLEAAGLREEDLSGAEADELLDQCREAKEALAPQTRRIAVSVGEHDVLLPVAALYERCAGLLSRSLEEMEPLVATLDNGDADLSAVAGIYLVGGASCLPLVPRMLRERFGSRVHRSPYPGASTAIGLAIAADRESSVHLTERLARGLGVFREADGGARTTFDVLLAPGSVHEDRAGTAGTVVVREYPAAHNIGWFRFVECAGVDESGEPRGGMTPACDVIFPFDRGLRGTEDLASVPVHRLDHGPRVQERYEVDADGLVRVTLTDLSDGFSRTFLLGGGARG